MDARGHQPADVLVRMLRTETLDDPERWMYARTMLGVEEAQVFARLRSAPARRDYLGAHLLARVTLAEFLNDEPAHMQIVPGPAGRPLLERPPGAPPVSFCVSRSDHVVACAVSAGDPIGVDVESVLRIGPESHDEAWMSASPHDPHTAMALRRHLRRKLMILSLREAIARAVGPDTRVPLDGLTVDPTDGLGGQELVQAADSAPAGWRFAIRRVTSDHIVAVAIRCSSQENPTIRFGAAELPPFASGRRPIGLTRPGRSDITDSLPQPMGHVGL